MTPGHIIFIPGALMIGMFLGFILGTRAARNQFDLQQKRAAEREAARAEGGPHPPPPSPKTRPRVL
jgi:hypothetical protein